MIKLIPINKLITHTDKVLKILIYKNSINILNKIIHQFKKIILKEDIHNFNQNQIKITIDKILILDQLLIQKKPKRFNQKNLIKV